VHRQGDADARDRLLLLEWTRDEDPVLVRQCEGLAASGAAQLVQVELHDLAVATGARSFQELAAVLRDSLVGDATADAATRWNLIAVGDGAPVALRLAQMGGTRVASWVLWEASGVQEFDLLGTYPLNHLLYGLQWVGLRAVDDLLPHFGWLDRSVGRAAVDARIHSLSDRRPLRALLSEVQAPMLVVHRRDDTSLSTAVAREHARVVPQAELHLLGRAEDGRGLLAKWIERVDAGETIDRSTAPAERVAAAGGELPRRDWVRAHGSTLRLLLFLLVLGTFITEDLTSIAAGLLIADGRLSWAQGLGAVFCGIYFGDQSLYLIGRVARRNVVHRRPWKWLLRVEDLDRASRWFERRGLVAILLTRFVPGTRLPTYVAAGVVRAGYWRFAGYFLVAVALWTPLLVGFSARVGSEALDRLHELRKGSFLIFVALALAILLVLRVGVPLCSSRGRRRLWAQWVRVRHWEFWPPWLIYLPVLGRILRFARRYGGLRVVTAVNPGIPAGGLMGESKVAILDALGGPGENVPLYRRVPAGSAEEQRAVVEDFLRTPGVELPIVIKPDLGERGRGVVVVHDVQTLDELLRGSEMDWIVQVFIPGQEYGIFYVRPPGEAQGRIFSVNSKERLSVEGDGVHDLEWLIDEHPRASILAEMHLRANASRLELVPARGESVEIVEIGAHARGCVFHDVRDLVTPELVEAMDRISHHFDGFFFGRYDVRVPSSQALREGRDLKVIELNGLTSEAAHIYDPSISLSEARATLTEQWRMAFEIGAANRRAGHPLPRWSELFELWGRYRQQARQRPATP
jgi:membrane protein DedA with SNARE-associated domain